MKAQQNIHQLNLIAQRALNTWSDSLCGSDTIIGFIYNNEPKKTKTGI